MTTAPAVDWTALNNLAQNVARNVARNWPGIDADDLAQEALTALVERPGIATQDNEKLTIHYMTRVMTQWASNERYEYTMRTAQYVYTPKEVRGLLSNAFWDEHTRETAVPTGRENQTQLLVWQNVSVAIWDLDEAFKRLSAVDRFRLEKRFKDEEEYSTDAAKKACNRAVDKLTKLLNQRVNHVGDADD